MEQLIYRSAPPPLTVKLIMRFHVKIRLKLMLTLAINFIIDIGSVVLEKNSIRRRQTDNGSENGSEKLST